MSELLKVLQSNNPFKGDVKPFSLSTLYHLRDKIEEVQYVEELGQDVTFDHSFGTTLFKTTDPGIEKLNQDYCSIHPFIDAISEKEGQLRMSDGVAKAWFHRTMCAYKAIEIWEQSKRIYQIDKAWYDDFINTEDVPINFALLERLTFHSICIDLSGLGLRGTKHYQNVVGVLVTKMDDNTLHFVTIDTNNEPYNPAVIWDIDSYFVTIPHPKTGLSISGSLTKKELQDRPAWANGKTYQEYAEEHGTIVSMHETFPEAWRKRSTGTVRFVDFAISRQSDHSVLSVGDHAASVFGWSPVADSVIDATDMYSPLVTHLMRFTISFLYFLCTKSDDILPALSESASMSIRTDPVQRWNVGVRYGQKIRTIQRKCQLYGDRVVQTERNRPRAYVRSAHWHTYWCGSGDEKHTELRWLEPTYCNGSISDIVATINQVTDEVQASDGENAVASYLKAMGVKYDTEYVVPIKGHNRRFDFHLAFNEKELFIEFDGEQHFRPVEMFGGESAFRELVRADRDKNKWAKQHKIPLLRIRYDQMQDIPELIDAFLEHPSIHYLNPKMDNSKYYNQF